MVKHLLKMQETRVWSLGREDPLENEMATCSSILVCRIPWTEESGGLQSMGLQRVRYNWHFYFYLVIYKRSITVTWLSLVIILHLFWPLGDRWHSPFLKSLYASPHVPFYLFDCLISVYFLASLFLSPGFYLCSLISHSTYSFPGVCDV